MPRSDILVLPGDFNVRVGARLTHEWRHVGPFVHRDTRSDNGDCLAEFAVCNDLCLVSTMFRKKRHRLATWKSNDHRTISQIDHLLVARRWRSSVMDVNTHWRKLSVCSDHTLVVSELQFSDCRRSETVATSCTVHSRFQEALANRFASHEDDDSIHIDRQWHGFAAALTSAAIESIGRVKYKKKIWLMGRSLDAFRERMQARDRGASRDELRRLRWSGEIETNTEQIAEEGNTAARAGNSLKLFQAVKRLAGERTVVSDSLRASDRSELKKKEEKLTRWKEHFSSLLNCAPPSGLYTDSPPGNLQCKFLVIHPLKPLKHFELVRPLARMALLLSYIATAVTL